MHKSTNSQSYARNEPCVVSLSDVPELEPEDAPTKVRIARAITHKRCGSSLLLGTAWMDPGEKTNVWSSQISQDQDTSDHWYGPVQECYFIITGKLQLAWDGGVLSLGPNDAVYLAPGWTYELENIGNEQAFFVYTMTPTPE